MIEPLVKDEFSPLEKLVLGSPESFGGTPKIENAYDPKSRQHIINGTYPSENDVRREMNGFLEVLEKHGVEVIRPETIENYNQVFSRDIAFVIDQFFVVSNVIVEREREIEGIQGVIDQINPDRVKYMAANARLEGGDITPVKNKILVGYSEEEDFNNYKVARTNKAGVEFIRDLFPDKEVIGFELVKSDTEPRDNCLHLDCCFQSLGKGHALLYPAGFKNPSDLNIIYDLMGKDKCLDISREEMYTMQSNVFSIKPDVIVSDGTFTRVNTLLRDLGYFIEEIEYQEIAKMEGLLRCSTLPLERNYE